MSYEIRTAILDPKTGYNKAANEYRSYWEHLDTFDNGAFLKFIPRDLNWFDILDLGAGDGRMYQFFAKENFKSFTACDIAEKLLAKHPNTEETGKNISKVICNLEERLPFDDESFDMILSFFVLEHIDNLDWLFEEVTRIMRPWSVWIIGHFLQRRAHKYTINHESFKIHRHTYYKEDLIKAAEYNFLNVFVEEIKEDTIYIGDIIVLKKD